MQLTPIALIMANWVCQGADWFPSCLLWRGWRALVAAGPASIVDHSQSTGPMAECQQFSHRLSHKFSHKLSHQFSQQFSHGPSRQSIQSWVQSTVNSVMGPVDSSVIGVAINSVISPVKRPVILVTD